MAAASVYFRAPKDYAGHHLVRHAYDMVTSHVLLVWLLSLVLVGVCGFIVSSRAGPMAPVLSERQKSSRSLKLPSRITLIDRISVIALLLFVTGYIALIFYKEDFAYYDDDMLTDFSLRGHNFPPPIWPSLGRFYPLADQEFNLLRFITRSPVGYHSFVVVQLLVLLGVLFVALKAFKLRYRTLILIAVMLAPSFVIPFTGFVYPERNVLFWLALMVLCLQGYSKTKARTYFVGCLVATQFVLYYKETVVLLVVAYAAARLLLQVRGTRLAGLNAWRNFARENALSLGMLAVSGIYVALFAAVVLPQRSFSYVTENQQALSSVFLAYLQVDCLPLILFVVVSIRVWRFAFSDGHLDPLWDPLAVGVLAYCAGILAVRLNSGYYLAPADFIAVLYLATMAAVWLSRPTKIRLSVVAVALAFILLQETAYSSFRMIERKNLITTKRELAEFLKSYQATANSTSLELFFPYSSGYHLMGLSSYFRYRGVRLAGEDAAPVSGPRMVIEGSGQFDGNRCVGYREYACVREESAGPGTLIIVLPDDNASMGDVESIAKKSVLLLALSPCAASTGAGSKLRLLHAISVDFSMRALPEHWLQLHVFRASP
jgi:hypothetical protein